MTLFAEHDRRTPLTWKRSRNADEGTAFGRELPDPVRDSGCPSSRVDRKDRRS